MMRLATFNVQNMRLRTRGSEVHLDGARDADVLQNSGVDAVALDEVDRSLTAAVLREADADVVALQEVFDQATLDYFHDNVLILSGAQPYPYRVCPPGNDGRGMDVAVISRLPLDFVASHADATPASLGLQGVDAVGADDRIFRRDCLEVTVGPLTLFVCHFKAPDRRSAATSSIRRLEALAVRRLVERRFSDVRAGLWLIAGDLNEPPKGRADSKQAIAPLLDPFSVDLLSRLPREERWSYYQPGLYSRPDALLASPELARRYADAIPRIIRVGLGWETDRYPGKRLAGVGEHRPHASDHAALAIEFAGL